MKIPKFVSPSEQMCNIGKEHWSVARLHMLAKDLVVMDIPLNQLYVYYTYEKLTLREMASHMNAVNEADLSYPIIIDEDGELMDGRHRIMKAMIEEAATIKAVRFDENPRPCEIRGAGE